MKAKEKKAPAKKMGRPTKLTNDLVTKLSKLIADGIPKEQACRLCDITRVTYQAWIKIALSPEATEPFLNFLNSIEKADAICIARRLSKIEAAAAEPKTWQAGAWLLERTHPELFGLRQNLAVHQTSEPIQVEVKQAVIDIDRIASVLAILEASGAIPRQAGESGVSATLVP